MSWRLTFHPLVRDDLPGIARLTEDYAGRAVARRKLGEIEAAARSLADNRHRGTRRNGIAPDLRALPAGRRGVIAFVDDDNAREVRMIAIGYGGADWAARVRAR